MNQIKNYIIAILVIGVGVLFLVFKSQVSDLEKENYDLKTSKREELKKVRDSAYLEIDKVLLSSEKTFDSILNIPPKVKYIPYEKPVYPNRSLDDALLIHADYKANKGAKRKN